MSSSTSGYVAIIGSGELSDSMAEVHRHLMARVSASPHPVFIDSLAGFELNIGQIDQKALAYFERNFDLELALARHRVPGEDPAAISEAVLAIQRSNYLLAGPGSPSYGIRLWRESPVWQAILSRWQEGAGLVFASAAAIVLGRYAIPVYEIYKAGHDVAWIEGLDVLSRLGIQATVVPHWNNQSGEQHDTRFCFMGAPRFAQLEAQLPPGMLIIGVDEYTALLINNESGIGIVLGNGQVTLRRDGCQVTYGKGEQVALKENCTGGAEIVPIADAGLAAMEADLAAAPAEEDIFALRHSTGTAMQAGDLAVAVAGLVSLGLIAGAGLEQGIFNRAELAVQALQALLPQLVNLQPKAEGTGDVMACDRLLDLLVSIRGSLRAAGQWVLADQVRDGMAALGYEVKDTSEGTMWQAQE